MPTRVLLIDDHADTCETLAMVLSAEGFEPYTAINTTLGISMAGEIAPDIVLLDLSVDGFSPEEFADKLRTQHPKAKLVLLSGANELEAAAQKLNADGYVSKPCDFGNLIKALKVV